MFTGIHFFGVFSPAPVIVPFGLYFFSLAQSFRATLFAWLTCTVLYAVMFALTVGGVMPDVGVVRGTALPLFDALAMFGIVEAIWLATFVLGRATRRASLQAVEKHDVAVRRLATREALLREARQELEMALQVGGVGRYTDMVLGSYELGQVIGRGGMGEVYEATHTETREPAAVKVLQKQLLGDPDNVRRFIREARIVEQLDVPQVVRVLEIGDFDAITPYIAMERLRGADLAEKLREKRHMSLRRTLELVRDVSRGLHAAQQAGVVHRDIKPRNLFHAEDEQGNRTWKILDFGVSKLQGQAATLTQGNFVGTPTYMAPEQAVGGEVTYLTDLYALGIICYRALTGRPAFTGSLLADLVYKVINTKPLRPSSANPALPPAVDHVLAIATAKFPKDRFQSGRELVAALEMVVRGRLDDEILERATVIQTKRPWGDDHGPPDSRPSLPSGDGR